MMFTSRRMDPQMVVILEKVQERLLLPFPVFFEPHEDSFYHYMLMQDDAFRKNGVLLCEMDKNDRMNVSRLMFNTRTEPVVAYIEKGAYSSLSGDDTARDMEFLDILQRELAMRHLDAAYLIGDGFKGGWMKSSVTYLLRGRRVFQGNNLFSKGASIAARERVSPTGNAGRFVFLGEDKLKANLGMKLLKCGTEVYHALLDAGVNWYEAQAALDIIMDPSGILDIEVTPLTGGRPRVVQLYLDGLAKRPVGTTRLHLALSMNNVNEVSVRVTDRGFGELFPATGKVWEQTIEV